MTTFEWVYLFLEPFMPVLRGKVRHDLKRILRRLPKGALMLDVGGRKSPYTIGLPAEVIILDLPREREEQYLLNLGVTQSILQQLHRSRSNIKSVILEDMAHCTIPSDSVDVVSCVEVLEHVRIVEPFLQQVQRVLKPGGFFYMTTPNGDYIRNEPPHYNPDHVRHFTRDELNMLLNRYFDDVQVEYGIRTGKYRLKGLYALQLRRPLSLIQSAISNIINRLESRKLENQPRRTAHLFALSRKP